MVTLRAPSGGVRAFFPSVVWKWHVYQEWGAGSVRGRYGGLGGPLAGREGQAKNPGEGAPVPQSSKKFFDEINVPKKFNFFLQ